MSALRRIGFKLKEAGSDAANLVLALGAAGAIGLVRLMPERRAADLAGRLTVWVGMKLPRTRKVGLKNVRLAFPEKTAAEHDAILRESWDNLGRLAVEYCHIDRIWDFDVARMAGERVEVSGIETYLRLRDDGKPAIIVSAHLANWELPMLASAAHGLDAVALYRAPNNRWIAKWVLGQRKVAMGELIASRKGSVHHLSRVLSEGRHLGLVTDQYFYDGVRIPFFGHPTYTNTLFARLARIHDCPVHAVRVVRLPGDRFRLELSEELQLPRDSEGKVDISGAAAVMNQVFEDWIREYPGQWLWFHRKWRDDAPAVTPRSP